MVRWLIFYGLVCISLSAVGNNLLVSDVKLLHIDAGTHTAGVQFDISWDNSWRISGGAFNHDAAWVFVKYQTRGSNQWRHATLISVANTPPGSEVDLAADGLGAMLYRAEDGGASAFYFDTELRWDYGADGVTDAQTDRVAVRVYAVEMVYVPEGRFSLGSGGDETSAFYRVSGASDGRIPYPVTSEAAIGIGSGPGQLYYEASTHAGDQRGPLPAEFPKGFAGFYSMKYELSQQQYVDFFNSLTSAQRTSLDPTGSFSKNTDVEVNRNGMNWNGIDPAYTTLPDVPVNFLQSRHYLAYLDWAALRPMTELEYEKACRGPVTPLPGEYAWGTAECYSSAYTLIHPSSFNEQIGNSDRSSTKVGNAVYKVTVPSNTATLGPVRVGTLGQNTTTFSRAEAGSSFYGITALSGNLTELVVTAGKPAGRSFRGLHGDGELNADGSYNVPSWPKNSAAYGTRGGSFDEPLRHLATSSRATATRQGAAETRGIHGVRSVD